MKKIFFILFIIKISIATAQPTSQSSSTQTTTTQNQSVDNTTKSQVESKLKGMSQSQIEGRLQEMGLTREEAIQKAKEKGLNVEDYLSSQSNTIDGKLRKDKIVGTEIDSVNEEVDTILTSNIFTKKKLEPIVGFTGRLKDEETQPFGYSIFNYPATTFSPIINVATPPNYLLGPGDEIIISVWGETKLYYQLSVNREGKVIVPEVGPVIANGSTIQQFRERLLQRMSEFYAGLKDGNTFLDVSLGKLRTIQIFVLGEVDKPGAYSLSSMSTAFHALYLAGGPSVKGTLRDIQVMRDGKSLSAIDFYDYILRGDKSKDHRLQDGDIVFVKPAGKRAALVGSVLRPAIYELKEGELLKDLLSLAGGVHVTSYFDRVHVERIIPFDERKNYNKDILDIDIRFSSLQELKNSSYKLEDGDILSVLSISENPENRVSIGGGVKKPGIFQLKPEMRIKDLITEADGLLSNTFSERGTILRLLPTLRREIISFIPRLAMEGKESDNLVLQNEDIIQIYEQEQFFPPRTVTISGAVRKPGTFIRAENMTLADLIVLAGGLKENAEYDSVNISRITITDSDKYTTLIKVKLPDNYWDANLQEKFMLQDLDYVFIPTKPHYGEQKIVRVEGLVMYPGNYAINYKGEKVADIIKRAGGFKKDAYLEGARFFRKPKPMEFNPVKLDTGKFDDRTTSFIPINLKQAYENEMSIDNIEVLNGDSIYIGPKEEVVYVRGEVYIPSPVLYQKGEGLSYYIKQAGGYTEEANESGTVVLLPTGKKWEGGWWIFPDPELPPGSSVYVPKAIRKEQLNTLQVISGLATILASITAVAITVINLSQQNK